MNKIRRRTELLDRALDERVVVLDGAMGTMIQALGLDEAGFRGEPFADRPGELRGNNDLLSLSHAARTRPNGCSRSPRRSRARPARKRI